MTQEFKDLGWGEVSTRPGFPSVGPERGGQKGSRAREEVIWTQMVQERIHALPCIPNYKCLCLEPGRQPLGPAPLGRRGNRNHLCISGSSQGWEEPGIS